jgi:hypothetical protein
MSIQDWTALIGLIITVITSAAIGTKWLVKHYLAELKPNGGGSMRDSVNRNSERLERVEQTQEKQGQRIDDIYRLLIEKNN